MSYLLLDLAKNAPPLPVTGDYPEEGRGAGETSGTVYAAGTKGAKLPPLREARPQRYSVKKTNKKCQSGLTDWH